MRGHVVVLWHKCKSKMTESLIYILNRQNELLGHSHDAL